MQIQSKSIKINFKFKAFHKYQFKLVLPKILQKTKGLSLQNKSFASLPLKIQRTSNTHGNTRRLRAKIVGAR